MIDLNHELSISDTQRSELIQYLFDDMNSLKELNDLASMQSTEIYNHFVDKSDLPAWIRQRIAKDFVFAAKLHEVIVRYKDSFNQYTY